MRFTKDNYELIMFDLLEGNIPEQEVDDLVQQIQEDEFLAKEWELFQATVVSPEPNLMFEQKASLIKEESKVIPLGRWIAVGVAACLLFAVVIMAPWNADTTEIAGEIPIKPNIESSSTDALPAMEELNTQGLVDKTPLSIPVQVKPQQNQNSAEPVLEEVVDHDETEVYRAESIVTNLSSKAANQSFSQSNLSMQVPDYVHAERNLDLDVTSSQLARITGKATTTMNKLSKPEVRFKPDWKERQFDLEVETTGYHAMASVNPFKK